MSVRNDPVNKKLSNKLEIDMKRILFVVHNLKGGGVQKITLDTARYHAEIGNKVTILALEKGTDLAIDFPCNYQVLNTHKAMLSRPWLAIYYAFYKAVLRNIFPHSEFFWDRFFYTQIMHRFLLSQPHFDAVFVNGARAMSRANGVSHPNIVYSLHLPNVLATKPNTEYYNYLFKKLFCPCN